ncbi:MAG TPA: hypothetical protein VIG33_11595 [Pseudobdellovibrionaceae bacterium]|jgi:hypothetical protein
MKREFNHNVIEQGQTARHLVSWGCLFAGLMLTLLIFSGALALGVAVGGVGLSEGTTAQRAGIFTGVWFIISAVVALFAGGYFSVRLGKFRNDIVGVAHGCVIASLFVLLLLNQTATAVSWLSRAATDAASGAASMVGGGLNAAAQNGIVSNMVEDTLGDMSFKSDPDVVISGVAARLVRGDTVSAKNYLARQSGLSAAEVDQRITALRAQVDQATVKVREATASAMKATGWSLFFLILFGAIAAAVGGVLASQVNNRKPLAKTLDEPVPLYGTSTAAM